MLSRIVWIATLIAIGVAALASWAVGAHVLFARARAVVGDAAALLFALNVAVVLLRQSVVRSLRSPSMRRPSCSR